MRDGYLSRDSRDDMSKYARPLDAQRRLIDIEIPRALELACPRKRSFSAGGRLPGSGLLDFEAGSQALHVASVVPSRSMTDDEHLVLVEKIWARSARVGSRSTGSLHAQQTSL